MLPSYSFGAEGVEYGRKASFYELSSGPVVLPSDLLVKGSLTVNGSSILNGPAVVNNNLTVSGNETVGGTVTILGGIGGTALTVGQNAPGQTRDLVVTRNTFTGGSVTITQGATGGVPGLVVTNAGIGGNPVRSVSVFNDQANPGTLISMNNGTDAGTIAYTGTAFQLSRPLTIPVQAGSSGNVNVGGGVYGIDTVTRVNFPAGFLAPSGTISGGGTGGSLLLLGDAQRPGGAIVGYDGVSVTRPPNFPFGLVTTVPTVTKSGIDDPVLNWDQTLVPGVGYKQDGPGTVYIPTDWQTNLDLPAGLFATFISYGIGNSTCNAVTRDGTVRQTTGSRTTPNITYFYLMRSANGINNTIVYVVQQGIATGASIPQ